MYKFCKKIGCCHHFSFKFSRGKIESGIEVKYSLCVNHQRRCKQYCKTTLVIQTKCKFENFVVCDVPYLP